MCGMHSSRRDLTIGEVGSGPSLANLIESQTNRSEDRSPSTDTILENPLLGGGKNIGNKGDSEKTSDFALEKK